MRIMSHEWQFPNRHIQPCNDSEDWRELCSLGCSAGVTEWYKGGPKVPQVSWIMVVADNFRVLGSMPGTVMSALCLVPHLTLPTCFRTVSVRYTWGDWDTEVRINWAIHQEAESALWTQWAASRELQLGFLRCGPHFWQVGESEGPAQKVPTTCSFI